MSAHDLRAVEVLATLDGSAVIGGRVECGGKCLDDHDLWRNWNCAVQLKPHGGQKLEMFVLRPILPTGHRQHDEIDHLAQRWRVVVAAAVV